ncbi:MarR family winged helix-turn-helix transcriptional regulator [Miltoncostaea marina]|uniref:MarR family winged helix-turn-helix transcriptional regulator n=1 Tax=Miltoncostaea marina TaxID=2843215 RepID=UPI001C3CF874|nr:MarR family winged helix-turn-helix transcriptional regulator [Miltoncostaea marina]
MDEESVIRLRDAVMRTARLLRTTASDEDLSPGQSSVLATLVREGPSGAGRLAAAEAMHPTMLSRVLAHLEGLGLVERGPSPDDARCTIARATPAGRRRVARLRAARAARLLAWLEGLDEADVARLAAALPALEALARAGEDA